MQGQVAQLVSRVIRENTGREVELAAEDSLIRSGLLDSMTMVALVIALQKEFGVEFAFGDMSAANFESVANITQLLEERAG